MWDCAISEEHVGCGWRDMFEVESIDKDVVGVWMRIIIEWYGGKHYHFGYGWVRVCVDRYGR